MIKNMVLGLDWLTDWINAYWTPAMCQACVRPKELDGEQDMTPKQQEYQG